MAVTSYRCYLVMVLLVAVILQKYAVESVPWVADVGLEQRAEARKQQGVRTVVLDLDVEPAQRWSHIAAEYARYIPAVRDYLRDNIPEWADHIIQTIGEDVDGYFGELGQE